jgi:hypothetical protein
MHESDAELVAAMLPLAVCLFFVTFFCGNRWFPVVRLSQPASRAVWATLAAAVMLSVLYMMYIPPDGMDEGLAVVASGVKLRDGLDMPCHGSPPNPAGLRLKIISSADGPKAIALGEVSARLTRNYAARHEGYAFYMYHDCRPRIRHLQWTKIPLLYREMLDPSPPQWLMWLDADAVFTETAYDVHAKFLANLPPETVLVVAEDIGGDRPINTGMMAIRSGEEGKRLLRMIWNTGRDLKLLRAWFHEQGTLTHLTKVDPWVAGAVVVLGGKWDASGFRVKMYTDGSIAANSFDKAPFAWRLGDTIGHAIGPKAGGTHKLNALHELDEYIQNKEKKEKATGP